MGAVTVRATTASLHLSYQLVAGEGSAVAVDEVVNLRSTETSLGGIRRWFACPGCNRRSRILYGGPRFRCRLCHGLSVRVPIRKPCPARQPACPQDPAAPWRVRLPDGGIPAQAARHAQKNV